MYTKHTIICGDSRQMDHLAEGSIQLIVTSPPCWQLKDYDSGDQIGYNQDYESYINHLNLIWKECHRVLAPGCRLCINIGDQFARAVYYGRYKVIPIRTEIIKFCETIGMDYMGAIIWQKLTTTNMTGGASVMGSYPYPRNRILSIDYEFILLFKKLGSSKIPDPELKQASALTKAEWEKFFSGHWNFGGTRQVNHLAMFPEELPYRLIKMLSFVGDTVLDPFLGSGTTSAVANKLDCNSVGYEINPDYIPLIKHRLNIHQPELHKSEYRFLDQEISLDFDCEIQKLPYIFREVQSLDKRVDPHYVQFGSKINHEHPKLMKYHRVAEVIRSDLVRLSDDTLVRLIGIKEKPDFKTQAVDFLKLKTRNQQVFLKFDQKNMIKQAICLRMYTRKTRHY